MWFLRKSKPDVESEEALADAKKNLQRIQNRGPEVTNTANSLKNTRETNHFAEQLEGIFIRYRGSPQ